MKDTNISVPEGDPVIILAGGFGTRLKSYLDGRPKPMADINGKPFLEYLLRKLVQNGYKNLIFSLHYQADVIIDYLNSIKYDILADCHVRYYVENTALGTGGAICYIISRASDINDFYIVNADTWIKDGLFDFRFLEANVIALIEVEEPDRYGLVEVNSDNVITNFIEKGEGGRKGLINAGFGKLNKSIFENEHRVSFSLERDLFPELVELNQLRGYVLQTEFIDIGVPKDYLRFCEDNREK